MHALHSDSCQSVFRSLQDVFSFGVVLWELLCWETPWGSTGNPWQVRPLGLAELELAGVALRVLRTACHRRCAHAASALPVFHLYNSHGPSGHPAPCACPITRMRLRLWRLDLVTQDHNGFTLALYNAWLIPVQQPVGKSQALPPPLGTRVQVAKAVMGGERLQVPPWGSLPGSGGVPFVGLQAYVELMQACWAQDPDARPSFQLAASKLRQGTWSRPPGLGPLMAVLLSF
jgi:hypothetical protein